MVLPQGMPTIAGQPDRGIMGHFDRRFFIAFSNIFYKKTFFYIFALVLLINVTILLD
jgi:hypothetical protein